MIQNPDAFHSADVQIWLECSGYQRIAVRRVTPNAIVVENPVNVPPCNARLVVCVDGEQMVTNVTMVSGLTSDKRLATALPLDDIAPF